jgi:hypothetical protein
MVVLLSRYLNEFIVIGSPWDEDKAMMNRWGLQGMQSFEHADVRRKEGLRSDPPTNLNPESVPHPLM